MLSVPYSVGHSTKDSDPLMGTTQSRSLGREASRVTTLRVPREDVLVVPMSLVDVAARVQ